eukprot:4211118-Pleurochrysis_carterae.AAC.2
MGARLGVALPPQRRRGVAQREPVAEEVHLQSRKYAHTQKRHRTRISEPAKFTRCCTCVQAMPRVAGDAASSRRTYTHGVASVIDTRIRKREAEEK